MNNKKAQKSIEKIVGWGIGLLLFALIAFILINNNPFGFVKFLPTFNQSDNQDPDVLKAEKMLKEARENPAKTTRYDCRVLEKGVCLNYNQWLSLTAEKPIDELPYCDVDEYCYEEKYGCFSHIPKSEKLIQCYNYLNDKKEDFHLPEVCEENQRTNRDCVCLDKEGYDYYFVDKKGLYVYLQKRKNSINNKIDYISLLVKRINSDSPDRPISRSQISSEENLGKDYFNNFLSRIEICNKREYCGFGEKGCYKK